MFEWEVETYNPAFWTHTCYINWHGDQLVYIYTEKHNIYGVTATQDQIATRIEIGKLGGQISIDGDIVFVLPVWKYQGYIQRYRIPEWEELSSITENDAIKQGIATF